MTGGIACGKSTVADFWRRWGAEVLDADHVAHALIAREGACAEAVVQAFGARVRAAGGGVDRKVLGPIVFADAVAREKLGAFTVGRHEGSFFALQPLGTMDGDALARHQFG